MQRCLFTLGLIALLGIFTLAAAGAAAPSSRWSQEKLARVDALVRHFLRSDRHDGAVPPPALSLAIGIDGALVVAKGYGDARPGVRASGETVYHIGSLTKQFTAAAVLRLIEERVPAPLTGAPLTLATPMRAIFSGVDSWTAKGEPAITVKSLLSMTSNLPNFTRRPPPNIDPWGAVPAPRLLEELKKQSPQGWPNSFEYSNTSYFILAQVVEAVRAGAGQGAASGDGDTFRDYVRTTTIKRAGMAHTGFVGDDATGSQLALAHYRRKPAFAKPAWLNGCGDMASNAVDLFAWNRALLEGRIIGVQSLKEMFSDAARVGPVTYYGMGWFITHGEGWDDYSHSGSVPGFTSYNAIHKRRDAPGWVSVTLLTNADGVEGLDQLADDLFGVVVTD